MNCEKTLYNIVNLLGGYLRENGLRSMVLGVSGGLDSLVVAYICRQVSDKFGIKFIAVSLPTKTNEVDEVERAEATGKLFSDQFIAQSINGVFTTIKGNLCNYGKGNRMHPTRQSNIKARLRMLYLMDIAQDNWGTVIGTDNKTEHTLGFYTIFGDQGMIEPIIGLWKSEVYTIARYILDNYKNLASSNGNTREEQNRLDSIVDLFDATIEAVPTDGNGGNPDLVQIGCSSYFTLDHILQGNKVEGEDLERIWGRVNKNKFKENIPVKFNRKEILL